MKNQLIPMAEQPQLPKYGVTESKKAELDSLTLEVLDQQGEVDKFQAMVTSLTEKSNLFQGYLSTADTNRTLAQNNKDLVDSVVNAAKDLSTNSSIAYDEVVLAMSLTDTLANDMKDVIDKLIYSAEVIEKLSNLVIRTKALNPLISDDLVSQITQAGTDANNAVALTLIALQSTFTAQATNTETGAASVLEKQQAENLVTVLTKNVKKTDDKDGHVSIKTLLYRAYAVASNYYDREFAAMIIVTNQLNDAQASLDTATIKLQSLEAGLAAATAAALAS